MICSLAIKEEDEVVEGRRRGLEVWRVRRAMMTCQWFLTALSVLPGKSLAMMDHLFPWIRWAAKSLSSSSSVKGFRLILGSNWLNHLNLQLLPERPGSLRAMAFQLWGPYCSTRSLSFSSSAGLQWPRLHMIIFLLHADLFNYVIN